MRNLPLDFMPTGVRSLPSRFSSWRSGTSAVVATRSARPFYVGPRPVGTWSDEGEHRNQSPEVERGMVVLDVVDGSIRYVEVIDRPEIRAALENAIQRIQ